MSITTWTYIDVKVSCPCRPRAALDLSLSVGWLGYLCRREGKTGMMPGMGGMGEVTVGEDNCSSQSHVARRRGTREIEAACA